MRILRGIFIILFAIAAVLGLLIAGGWWWLNSYIQSPAFTSQVKQEATRLTGSPVNFTGILWEWGRGITLENPSLRNPFAAPGQGEFKSRQVILKYDASTLLDRKFEITRLTLKQPSVVIGQDAEGNYILPVKTPVTSGAITPTPLIVPKSPAIEIQWQSFNLEKGSVEVKSNDGSTRLQCQGVEAEAVSTGTDKPGLRGQLNIASIELLQKVKISSVRSPMSFDGDTFALSAVEAQAYGGRITGEWEQNFSDSKKAYNLKLNLEDCDVNSVVSGMLGKSGVISGRLDARTLWLGPATDPMEVSGKGTIELHNGQLIQVAFFQSLARLLGVQALGQPDFSACKLEFTVAEKMTTITLLQLKSALFELSGTGTVGFDSHLNMKCELDLSPDLTKQLPEGLGKAMELKENGYRSVPFTLTGTLGEPKVNLTVSPVMVNQAIDALKGLLNKKNKHQPAPTPAPAVTPASDVSSATPTSATPATSSSETVTPPAPTSAPVVAPSTNAPAAP